MPFWQCYQKLADWLDWPALLVQPSISAHRKWPEMVVSASTNQVWTKITIETYAWSFAIQIRIQAVWGGKYVSQKVCALSLHSRDYYYCSLLITVCHMVSWVSEFWIFMNLNIHINGRMGWNIFWWSIFISYCNKKFSLINSHYLIKWLNKNFPPEIISNRCLQL